MMAKAEEVVSSQSIIKLNSGAQGGTKILLNVTEALVLPVPIQVSQNESANNLDRIIKPLPTRSSYFQMSQSGQSCDKMEVEGTSIDTIRTTKATKRGRETFAQDDHLLDQSTQNASKRFHDNDEW